MKKYLIIIIAVCASFVALNSCKKTGGNINPLSDIKNMKVGTYLVQDSLINANLNSTSGSSLVGIIVHQFPAGEAVDHIQLYGTLGTSTDTLKWKLIKSIPYSNGSKVILSATTDELSKAFGVPASNFTPGSVFTFFTQAVTKSGLTYDITNAGNNGGGGLVSGSAYKAAFSFTVYVVCPYTGGMAGSYKVVRDDWGDWNINDIVKITEGTVANQINLSQIYPGAKVGGTLNEKILVNIDPVTGTATVPKVTYGRYPSSAVQYTAQGASSNNVAGYVFSCTGFITLSLDHQGGGTDYGANKLILQKQ